MLSPFDASMPWGRQSEHQTARAGTDFMKAISMGRPAPGSRRISSAVAVN